MDIQPTSPVPISAQPISLDTTQPSDLINLNTGLIPSLVSPEVADSRAYKAQFSPLTQPYDQIRNDILSGNEDRLRLQAATKADTDRRIQREQAVADIVKRSAQHLNDEDIQKIYTQLDTAPVKRTSPYSVFEEYYNADFLNALTRAGQDNPDNDLEEAKKIDPDTVKKYADAANDITNKYQFLYSRIQNREEVIKKLGWAENTWDFVKGFVTPAYTQFNLRGNVTGAGFFAGGLQGENTQIQSQILLQMPFEQMRDEVLRIEKELDSGIAGGNKHLALDFLSKMIGQTRQEKLLDNIFSAADLAAVPEAGAGTFLMRNVRSSYKGMVKAMMSRPDPTRVVAAEAAGDIGSAAVTKVTTEIQAAVQGKPKPVTDALEGLPSFIRTDAEAITTNVDTATAELVSRLRSGIVNHARGYLSELQTMGQVERIPAVIETPEGVTAMKDYLRTQFTGPSNALYDISEPYRVGLAWYADYLVKDTTGEFFQTARNAEFFKHVILGMPKAEIDNQGLGYFLRVPKPVPETAPFAWNNILTSENLKSPGGWTGKLNDMLPSYVGMYRTPDEFFSLYERANRKAVAYGPGKLLEYAKGVASRIDSLSSGLVTVDRLTGEKINVRLNPGKTGARDNRWGQFVQMLEATKGMLDDDNKMGKFFTTVHEVQNFYLRNFNRKADDVELEAYFSYKDMNNIDLMTRNLQWHYIKSRVGVESHKFTIANPKNAGIDPITGEAGGLLTSPALDAVRHKNIPQGMVGGPMNTNHTLEISASGDVTWYMNGKISPRKTKQLTEDLANNKVSILELFDPDSRPLKNFPGVGTGRARFLIVNRVETEPLDIWGQLPRRGAGHFDTEYTHYLKWPIVKPELVSSPGKKQQFQHSYEGDGTFAALVNGAQGEKLASLLNPVIELMEKKEMQAAKDLYKTTGFTQPWKEFAGKFYPKKNPLTGAIEEPLMDLKQRLHVVQANQSIIKLGKEAFEKDYEYLDKLGKTQTTLVDNTKSGSLRSHHEVKYSAERDAYEMQFIKDEGTLSNPVFKVAPITYVDPVVSTNKALSQIIHSTFLDSYKDFAIQTWLAKSTDKLDMQTSDIRSSPIYAFQQAKFKDPHSGEAKNLEVQRRQIQQLLGVEDETALELRKAGMAIQDAVYNKRGPGNWAEHVDIPERLSLLKDPLKFLRGMAFHETFTANIPTFFTQSMQWVNIAAMSPTSASGATIASIMSFWARRRGDPATIAGMDKWASILSMPGMRQFKPGQFTEAYNLMKNLSFDVIQSEHVFDQLDKPILYSPATKMGRSLDAGLQWAQIPFRAGERNSRFGAWYSAYLEYREVNPTGRISNMDANLMRERADELYGNMSRASSSALHTGVLSVPAQFYSYQIRQTELFLGHRIPWQEKARLFAMQALLYGAPAATGLTLIPWGDFWRQNQISNEDLVPGVVGSTNRLFGSKTTYLPGQNLIQSLFNDGVPAQIIAYTTGEGDTYRQRVATGNYYNLREKYATRGLDAIREGFRDDPAMWKVLQGAAGSKLADMWAGTDGYMRWGLSIIRDDVDTYTVTYDDVLRAAQAFSTVNQLYRGYIAMSTGEWINKKGLAVTKDVTWKNALFMTITGLQPMEVSDAYTMLLSKKEQDHLWESATQEFIANVQKAARVEKTDDRQAREYMTNAYIILKIARIPENRLDGIIARAARSDSLVKSAAWTFLQDPRNMNIDSVAAKSEAYRQILLRDDARKKNQ